VNSPKTGVTIRFEKSLHDALRNKSAQTQRSISQTVSDAICNALRADVEGLAIPKRAKEKGLSYRTLIARLERSGTL
jgi:hypothetical protein